jgi:hypothetical protein
LNQFNWKEALSQLSVNQAWLKFYDKLFELKNQHVTEKNFCSSKKPPWINKDILTLINNKKKRQWKKYYKTIRSLKKCSRKELEHYILFL